MNILRKIHISKTTWHKCFIKYAPMFNQKFEQQNESNLYNLKRNQWLPVLCAFLQFCFSLVFFVLSGLFVSFLLFYFFLEKRKNKHEIGRVEKQGGSKQCLRKGNNVIKTYDIKDFFKKTVNRTLLYLFCVVYVHHVDSQKQDYEYPRIPLLLTISILHGHRYFVLLSININ